MDKKVAVIGLGTIGSLTAWKLASQGISVLGFEQFGIGHDRSAHGGGSRRFVVASSSKKHTYLAKNSLRIYRDLERETGQNFLSSGGTLTIGHYNSDRIKQIIENADKNEVPYEIFEKEKAYERFPQHRLIEGDLVIHDKYGGVLRPEQMIVTAVNRARRFGAKILTYTKVTNIDAKSDGVVIKTQDNKEFKVSKVIITNGPWANKLVPSIEKYFKVHRIIMNWFIAENPSEFTEDKFPNFSRISDGKHIIGTPTVDGRMVRVSDGSAFEVIDNADSYDKNVPIDFAIKLREHILEFLPNLNPDPASTMAFMDGYTIDEAPLVGPLKGNNRVILACGLSGSGISIGPALAEAVSELTVKNKTAYDIESFSPSRFNI